MAPSNEEKNGSLDAMDAPRTKSRARKLARKTKVAVRRTGDRGKQALGAVQGQIGQRPLLTLGLCAGGAFALGAILRPRVVQLAALLGVGVAAWRLSDGKIERVVRDGAQRLGLLSSDEE